VLWHGSEDRKRHLKRTQGPAVILFVELSARHNYHAPFNANFLQTICLAFPEQAVECWADETHLIHLRDILAPPLNLSFHSLRLSGHRPEKYELVSFRRLWHHGVALWSLVRKSSREPLLLVVSSGSAAAILAAAIVRLLFWRRRFLIQLPLHGQLNMIKGWRSRNPLYRAMDLKSALSVWHGPRFRYLVFEEHIKGELERLLPNVTGYVDVLPHPINAGEGADAGPATAQHPVRLALLGVATRSKGFGTFLGLAEVMKREIPGRVEFDAIGHVHREFGTVDLSRLEEEVGTEDLPRDVFIERLRRAHFVCLWFQTGGYYDLSASGTLLDAITWRKPIIASKHPLIDRLFADFGDIGYECASEAEVLETIRGLAQHFDPLRYQEQVHTMANLRDSRKPEAGAKQYRLLLRRFPVDDSGVRRASALEQERSVDRS
jgi:hypothetical protein